MVGVGRHATGAFAGQRAVVIGFGLSGRAAARVLLDEGAEVVVSEARPLDEIQRAAESDRSDTGAPDLGEPGLHIRAGGHRPEHLEGGTLVVVSPGVPRGAQVISWARDRGLPVWSELELGARLCRVPFVAVTGTNGKTTTVELVAAMMREAGLAAKACGNVGHPFSLAAREAIDALAVEASSFQLAFTETLSPRVSVLLNLAPDHLDWHGSFAEYSQAKARIYSRQSRGDTHVGNRDDAVAASVSGRAPCPVRWFGWGRPTDGDVGVVDGRVVTLAGATDGESPEEIDLGEPGGSGHAFAMDAAAAAAAALAFGIPPEAVRKAVGAFVPLPHRGATVATAGSVRFIDDSKATNPHAALAALDGLSAAVLIAGGLAKGVDLSPLAGAATALAGVVAIGEAAPAVASVFEGLVPVRSAGSIEEAVEAAFGLAPPGSAVVLAPACASQDMFLDYRERGERFAAAARALAARVERQRRAHAR
jgi:UDP-N-acetylmuramoylalanine--D-glutamate ligase